MSRRQARANFRLEPRIPSESPARTKPLARRTLPRGVSSKHQSAGLERVAVQRYDDVDISDKAQQ